MKAEQHGNGVVAKHAIVKGKRVVVLDEGEFQRLLIEADLWEPKRPEPHPDGNYPALEAVRASLAISIIRDRRRRGLTQAELARRAGIRLATLRRIEMVQVDPSIRTIKKIERALRDANGNGKLAKKGSVKS